MLRRSVKFAAIALAALVILTGAGTLAFIPWARPPCIALPAASAKPVTGMAVGPQGRVFVADFYNDRVQVFRPDGTFLTAFGETGAGKGQFNHAIALDVAADGTVYVADFLNDRVQIWEPAE